MALVAEPVISFRLPSLDLLAASLDTSMLSGAVGGPLAVGVLTPQRNAMTLAAKDITSTYIGLYRQVFARGFANGFCGGSKPMVAAAPQFTAIGPIYLVAERNLQSSCLAMLAASLAESVCTFAAQRRNAQVQYNATRTKLSERVAHQPLNRLVGPGFVPHVGRNFLAMTGIRLFSSHSLALVQQLPGAPRLSQEGRLIVADLTSSVFAATLSMPFNHVFSWAACTPRLDSMSYGSRASAYASFLVKTYQAQGGTLLARDLAVRISYTGLLFTLYRAVERNLQGTAL